MNRDAATQVKNNTRFSTIRPILLKYKRYLILGGIVTILSNVLILFTPYITKLVFDSLESGAPPGKIFRLVTLLFALAVFAGVFRFAMRRTIIWMSRYLEYDLRAKVFAHLLKLSPSYYHKSRTGDLMARMTNDLEAVRQMVGPGIMYISDTIIKLSVSLTVMLYMSPILTMWAVLPMLVMPSAVNIIANRIHKRSIRVQEKFSELTSTAQENLAGARVVKAYGQEDAEVDHFAQLSTDYIGLNMALVRLQGVFIPSMRLVASLSYVFVLYFGGLLVIQGELALGDIVAFFGYLSMILWPMIAIGWVTSLYQRGTASLDRINKVLFTPPVIEDGSPDAHSGRMKGRIELRNLAFAYDEAPIFDGINLTVEPGQTVGLIGLTGSGKTTLVSVLAKLYPVERGSVFIDGIDLNDWQVESLRRQVGFATQEPFLFSDTVAENIRFGNNDSDQQDVERVSRIAALDTDVTTFSEGYDTLVGERGITLSGGQKQRAAIARAILTDPALLILDDATSAVDTETEHLIQQRIKSVLTGRTSIIISHRVSSVKDADLIIYLRDGRIAEQGTHEELQRLDGHYADLYRSQLLEAELERL